MENITTTSLDYTELAQMITPTDNINTSFINADLSLINFSSGIVSLSAINIVNTTE